MILCRDPFTKSGLAFACGRCEPCLARRKSVWSHRLMLEALCHADSAFVNLTYDDKHMPEDYGLRPKDLQDFLKRLRWHINDRWEKNGNADESKRPKIRYYAVGEYGEKKDRPHYHMALFGFATCLRGQSYYTRERDKCCSQCEFVREVWDKGHVYLGKLTPATSTYICKYITKDMKRVDDGRLQGRHPEFARMSLRPGIGYNALWEVADVLMRSRVGNDDVPGVLRHGSIYRPLGKYLRNCLREMVGKEEADEFIDEEMQALWESAKAATPHSAGEVRRTVFRNMLVDAGDQRVLTQKARATMFAQKRKL